MIDIEIVKKLPMLRFLFKIHVCNFWKKKTFLFLLVLMLNVKFDINNNNSSNASKLKKKLKKTKNNNNSEFLPSWAIYLSDTPDFPSEISMWCLYFSGQCMQLWCASLPYFYCLLYSFVSSFFAVFDVVLLFYIISYHSAHNRFIVWIWEGGSFKENSCGWIFLKHMFLLHINLQV